VELAPLVEEIRARWHAEEGDAATTSSSSKPASAVNPYAPRLTDSQSQEGSESQFGTPSQFPTQTQSTAPGKLAEEVIWHCLRPILHCDSSIGSSGVASSKDDLPKKAQLLPDEVAKLAAHNLFLQGTPRGATGSSSSGVQWWNEKELMETWSLRLPSMSRGYAPRTELLRGIAISETGSAADAAAKDMETANGTGVPQDAQTKTVQWQYFPEAGLPLVPSMRIKSMFAVRDVWSLEDAMPYLAKFVVGSEKEGGARDILGKYAKAISVTKKDGSGKDISVTKYMALAK